MSVTVPGIRGYAENASALIAQYEKISFEVGHAPMLDLLPETPSDILDIGSGTGRDAAHLAHLGHRVTAVEPTEAFRTHAQSHHRSERITWIDDALPGLQTFLDQTATFDLIMMTAVWMHLDASDRSQAMPHLARLLRAEGRLILSLRHGPVPEGRVMYAVSAEETIELAHTHNLTVLRNLETASLQEPNRSAGVTWSRLAFQKRI